MVNPIPKFVKKLWSKWNIRAVILISLSLQIVLIFLAPFRKRTRKRIVAMLLWITYLLADYAANFCVGLTCSKYWDEDSSMSKVNDFLFVFWAPFLLLHLGGPDTITAYSLEDNELWVRHLLGLIVQVCLTGYVFILTLPANTFWVPTALVFVAGIIKLAERTVSLRRSSISYFSLTPNYAKLVDEYMSRLSAGLPTRIVKIPEPNDGVGNEKPQPSKAIEKLEVNVVRDAYHHFNIFKGIVSDQIFSFIERNESREYYLKQTPMDALRVIEVELNFFYEAFYTKASVVRNKVGYFFRFVAVTSVVAALVLFVFDQKHGCNEFDVKVTYTLLYGAVALDLVSLLMLVFSDDTFASFKAIDSERKNSFSGIRKFAGSIFGHFLNLKRPKWPEKSNMKGKFLCKRALFRRWSGSISTFNLLSYTLYKKEWWGYKIIDYIGAKECVEQWKYGKNKPLLKELWIFIFTELERKSADADDVETIQRICSSRGAWAIQESEILRDDINMLMPYVDANTVTLDQSIILWHIATDFMIFEEYDKRDTDEDAGLEREFSKLLSDYMLHLLIMHPTMTSGVRGFGKIRFRDACAEAAKFLKKNNMTADQEKSAFPKLWKEFCDSTTYYMRMRNPNPEDEDMSMPLLFPAVGLANALKNLEVENKWKMIAQVWVELLSFAACNCRPITHVQQLSQGGEFISLVWLLMTHLGLSKQFQIKLGRKLVVGEEDNTS